MKRIFDRLLSKLNPQLCSIALVAISVASQECRKKYYQPKEPEGLAEFVKRAKR